MLRKVSREEPTVGIVSYVCVEARDIAPVDQPPEALEVDADLPLPRPPSIRVPQDDGPVLIGNPESPPVCPVPILRSVYDSLTDSTINYYDYPPGTVIPGGCGIGVGVF